MLKTTLKYLLLLAATTGFAATVTATELTGVVKSDDGKPLANVQITTYAPAGPAKILGMQAASSTKRHEVTTNSAGVFKLPSHGQVIHFHRDDLRPVTKIVELSLRRLELTMEEGSRALWKIPACSAADKSTRAGIGFMVTPPANVRVRKETERFEEGGYFFGYPVGDKIALLVNWWESTALAPDEQRLIESREFSQRMWSSGKKWGYDFRGTMPDGSMWRQISLANGAIAYQNTAKEVAAVFDQMIDGMCFDESAVSW